MHFLSAAFRWRAAAAQPILQPNHDIDQGMIGEMVLQPPSYNWDLRDFKAKISLFFTEFNSIQKPVEVLIEDENEGEYCRPARARNIQWTWTKIGETAILPCPLGTSGLARWSCNTSGFWAESQPDMSDCKSEAATQLEARVRAEDPEAVLATSLAHMTSKSQFYGGDLDTAVAVMKTIGNRLR